MTEKLLGRTPMPIARIDADTTADTVAFLRSVGLTGGVVEPSQIDDVALTQADRRPIEVLDANGITVPVLVVDRAFEASLIGEDPELIAQHRFTELLFEAKTVSTDRGILLDLSTVDRVPLVLLIDLFETTDRLGLTSVDDLLARPPARDDTGSVLRVELLATPPSSTDLAASDLRLRLAEAVLDSYAAMLAPAEGLLAPLRDILTAAMSDELDADSRRIFADVIFDVVADVTAQVELIEASRITLASQTAALPVAIHNGANLAMNVTVKTTSEKLRFPDGEELQITLEPGLNEFEIPIEAVTSGDARMFITVTSPDGHLDLTDGSVNVRSDGNLRSRLDGVIGVTCGPADLVAPHDPPCPPIPAPATVSSTPSADDGNPCRLCQRGIHIVTVRIVTDSSCDLRGDEVANLNIEVVPLSIRFGDDEYTDREQLSVDRFYELLASSDTLPETAAPSPGRFAESFQRHLDAGATAIVCINISAALSATMQSAITAADSIDADIRVVDSTSITVGLGSIVIAAAEAAKNGASADEVVAIAESMSARTHVFGALDTLENLQKGGRIGGAQALLGSMLSIKPLIDISTGEVEEAGKQRTRKKSMIWMRDKLAEFGEIENLAIMHGEAPDIDDFVALISEVADVSNARTEVIGPVVGTHGGPRVVGYAFTVPE